MIQNLGLVDGLHLDLVAGALGRDGPTPGVRPQLEKYKNILHLAQKYLHATKNISPGRAAGSAP